MQVSEEEFSDNWDRIFNKAGDEIRKEIDDQILKNVVGTVHNPGTEDDLSDLLIQTIEDSKSK